MDFKARAMVLAPPQALINTGSVQSSSSTALSAEGLAYPLSVFTNWWQGTLNEALARHFIIRTEGKVLVFRVF